MEWRRKHDMNLLKDGSEFRDLHKPHIREIRKGLADFFHTVSTNVSLVPNFSYGMNTVLDGLPPGLKFLLLKGDYPSVNWPVAQRDFDVYYAEIDVDLERRISEAVKREQPDVLALSMVQYISGIKIDFDFLKQLKQDHPDLLILADGTQYLGTEAFDFENSAFDVVGASTYKWMLAGYGNGLFLTKEAAQNRILPRTIGYNSADNRREDGSIPYMGRMEPGHQDTLNYGSLWRSVQLFNEIGVDEISAHVRDLTTKAKSVFTAMDMLDPIVANRSNHSTIFNLKVDQQVHQHLKDHDLIASWRGDGMRVSFHLYNNENDLDRLVELIKSS